ncbi:MAG: PIN domain-containing protein [Propionibacteriaceae bacterium]|nr:PIN domain-containing protein [Propionibacteriaceae bacterium]
MTPPVAVLDACVLVPISLCDVLMELADAALYKPLWSQTILDETYKALVEKRGVPADRAERRIGLMQAAQPGASVNGFETLIPEMGNHPKDRHVLAAAVQAKCRLIVTANLNDFPVSALAPHGVKAVSPDAFLLDFLDDDADAVWAAVDHKRASYRRPPMTMNQFCEILAATVPRFAARLQLTRSTEPEKLL